MRTRSINYPAKDMNILHVNTYLHGGAAIAALRTHQVLLRNGVKSKFLCLSGNLKDRDQTFQMDKKCRRTSLKLIATKIAYKLATLTGKTSRHEMFSLPYSSYDISIENLIQEADIIHLHWISGFVDFPTFFKKIKKPIIWTLHDMNAFSGAFHYEDDRLFNESPLLRKMDMMIKRLKESIFGQVNNLYITTPSQWLMRKSKESKAFSHLPHAHVPPLIDTTVFKMSDKQQAREKSGLPAEGIIFTFMSEKLGNKRKGLEILLSSIKLLLEDLNEKVTIVNIGEGHCDINDSINMGRINDAGRIAEILSASDALLLPSREDNFPNVMVEANACGCPVIAFPVGGIKEFITDYFNGLLSQEVSAQSLKETLELFIANKERFDAATIREHIVKTYSPDNHAAKYIAIYKHLLADAQ
jgi:glycosyltransferase involved in cell wall biosynthesis